MRKGHDTDDDDNDDDNIYNYYSLFRYSEENVITTKAYIITLTKIKIMTPTTMD